MALVKKGQGSRERGGRRGNFPPGLRGLIINILISEIALKCIFSQAKGLDRKNVMLASLAGALISQFCP